MGGGTWGEIGWELPRILGIEREVPKAGMSGRGNQNSHSYKTYNNVIEYIEAKNADSERISYDSSTNKATITSVGDFIKNCKSPSKDVGAYDTLNRDQGENKVFGTNPDDKVKHFYEIMYNILFLYFFLFL